MSEVLEQLRSIFHPIYIEYAIEILIIYFLILTFLRFMEGTRGEGILKGIALVILTVPIVVTITADRFNVLDRLLVIMKFLGATAIPVLVIIVQPELRRALIRLGQTRIFGMFLKRETEGMVEEIVKSAFRMSRRKIGALVAIEREIGLKTYIERGTVIDGVVSGEVLSTIFFPGTDLHDGAAIIQKERVAAAGCLLPLSDNPNLGNVGTRHRAAVGITEETDAIVVVVSEETGAVSFTHGGKLERALDVEQLRQLLRKYYAQLEEAEAFESAVEPETEVGG
ncbi:MAG: diadenylate cyclase CdaA [Planctomycetes bacterium]|nr:diadenylate cyclase CdaA [Planctomycetota bacterium]